MLSKYENVNRFVAVCKNFVKVIEIYTGNDPLVTWYEYLMWIEEHFVLDFKNETIFNQILAKCLCQFENEERYFEDRRLVKLFIKYVSESLLDNENSTTPTQFCRCAFTQDINLSLLNFSFFA